MSDLELSKQIYRKLFTEEEWDAIFEAMGDYQDYGDDAHELMVSVRAKITALFS